MKEKTTAKIDNDVYKELQRERIELDEKTLSSTIMRLINIKRKAEDVPRN